MGKMQEGNTAGREVTVVLTSCGRHDLLHRTIESFFKFNTYPISEFIVFEDGGKFDEKLAIGIKYPSITYIGSDKRIGQVAAIDHAYSLVKTPYIFHLEDDWEFYKPGFIEQSLDLLEKHDKFICIWLRSVNDTNGHPLMPGGIDYKLLSTRYHWKGFTWNPGLRRLSDYKMIGKYSDHTKWDPMKPWTAEQNIGILYWKMGFQAAILKSGFVRHIGGGRHVK